MALPDKIWDMYSGRLQPIKDFYFNYNEYHEKYNYGRMYYTKEGCRAISSEMRKKNENFELFTIELCNFFHMPYISECMLKLKEIEASKKDTGKDLNYVYQYETCISELGLDKETEKKYWDNLYCNNNFLHIDLMNKVTSPTTEGDMDLFIKLKKYWGKQDTLEDYLLLEESFNEYTKDENLTPFIEKSFRRLCLAEMDLRKAREQKADQQEIKRIEDRIATISAKLKIDTFTSSKTQSAGEQSIFNWIYITEKERPIDENLDKHFGEDIAHIHEDYDDIMRATRNVCAGTKDYPELKLGDD